MAGTKSQDAIALLKEDHRKVEELFEQFEKAKGDGRNGEDGAEQHERLAGPGRGHLVLGVGCCE